MTGPLPDKGTGASSKSGVRLPPDRLARRFAVVLVGPQLGENIGATARAMLNFGLSDLRLVRPRDGWPNPRADANASGALGLGVEARVYDDLVSAVADRTFVLATCPRLRDMVKDVLTPREAAQRLDAAAGAGGRTAILFGPEKHGLDNDALAIADAQVRFPTNPGFSSLNLAQAVLLMAHEWFTVGDATPAAELRTGEAEPADKERLFGLFGHLEGALDEAGFFRSPDMRPTMVRNIRAALTRARLTVQEVSTFRGIVSAFQRPRKQD